MLNIPAIPLKVVSPQPSWRVDFSSSEREALAAAKMLSGHAPRFKGSTVFGLRATMYEVDVDGSSFVWRLMIGKRPVVRLKGGSQKRGNVCKEHRSHKSRFSWELTYRVQDLNLQVVIVLAAFFLGSRLAHQLSRK